MRWVSFKGICKVVDRVFDDSSFCYVNRELELICIEFGRKAWL